MIAVVGSDAALLNSVQNAIGDFEEQQLLGDIEEVLSLASKLRAAIVCTPALVPDEAARIATLHSRCPLLPLFVVARLSPAAVEAAYRLHGDVTIVWVDELGSLSAKLAEHLAKKPLELVYEAVRHRPSLSSLMLKALVLICVSPTLFAHVKGLSANLRISPLKLRRRWRKEVSRKTSPKELMDWRVLLEWIELAPTTTLDEAAIILGVDPRTLERIARRCVKLTPSKAAAEKERVHALFAEWVSTAFGNSA